uniref:glutathione S-transferase N-terminal domain-containing protein n=1 Tax=uncultured Pseudomonas sp. TaxID=114707 RepID=UPI00258A94AD
MDLFTYYRSTSSYRVRLALALKGLDYRAVPVNLLSGEQHQPAYRALKAQGRRPSLRLDSGEVLIQSPAILEYLEERYPAVPLLPTDPLLRARHR